MFRLSFIDTLIMIGPIFFSYFDECELSVSFEPISQSLKRLINTHIIARRTRREKLRADEIKQHLDMIAAARASNSSEVQSALDTELMACWNDVQREHGRLDSLHQTLTRCITLGGRFDGMNPNWRQTRTLPELAQDQQSWLVHCTGFASPEPILFTLRTNLDFIRLMLLSHPALIAERVNPGDASLIEALFEPLMRLRWKWGNWRGQIVMSTYGIWYEMCEWLMTFIQIHIDQGKYSDQVAFDVYSELVQLPNSTRLPDSYKPINASSSDVAGFYETRKWPYCETRRGFIQFEMWQRNIWRRGMTISAPLKKRIEDITPHHEMSIDSQLHNFRSILYGWLFPPLHRPDLCHILWTQSRQYQYEFHAAWRLLKNLDDVGEELATMQRFFGQFLASSLTRRTLGQLMKSGAVFTLLTSSTTTISTKTPSTSSTWTELLSDHESTPYRCMRLLYFHLIRGKEVRLLSIYHSLVPAAVTTAMRHPLSQLSPLHFLLYMNGCRLRIFDQLFDAATKHHDGSIDLLFEEKNSFGATLTTLLQRSKNRDLMHYVNEFYHRIDLPQQ